jgi:hypothetical protein
MRLTIDRRLPPLALVPRRHACEQLRERDVLDDERAAAAFQFGQVEQVADQPPSGRFRPDDRQVAPRVWSSSANSTSSCFQVAAHGRSAS